MMSIFRCGSAVCIGELPERIPARVLGVSMSGLDYCRIQYLCSWWDGRTHKEEWLDCELVEPCDETPSMLQMHLSGYKDK